VDRTPVRPAGEALGGGAVAAGAPAGLVLPQGATPARWLALRALGALGLAMLLHLAARGRRIPVSRA